MLTEGWKEPGEVSRKRVAGYQQLAMDVIRQGGHRHVDGKAVDSQ
jgi:hypothetical protein